jgi:hypothetical protein
MVLSTANYVISELVLPVQVLSTECVSDEFATISEISLGEQAYYWTSVWQVGEKEANEDIRKGRVKKFKDAKDTIKYLHSKRKK